MADVFNIDQRPILKRFVICIPLFAIGYGITLINFDVVWRYFAWANQALACVVLWTIFVWLARNAKNYWIALIPALFMTFVETYFVLISPQFFGFGHHGLCMACAVALTFGFMYLATKCVKGSSKLIPAEK